MPENTYVVTVEPGPDGPEPALLERLALIAAYRLEGLEDRDGHYPVAGGTFDMLDNLTGRFLWEMSDEELATNPPTRVDFEIVEVDPVERPQQNSQVRVRVRVPY